MSAVEYPAIPFERMTRKQAITTCYALEDQRDRNLAAAAAAQHLMIEADSICSLILHRESKGLSEQTTRDLDHVVTALRIATQP